MCDELGFQGHRDGFREQRKEETRKGENRPREHDLQPLRSSAHAGPAEGIQCMT